MSTNGNIPTSNFVIEKRGLKDEPACIEYVSSYYKQRCSTPKPLASFEERVAVLKEYGLDPLIELLAEYLTAKSIGGLQKPFTAKLITTLYSIVGSNQGEEKPLEAAEKSYNFVKTSLREFINLKIKPSLEGNVDITSQAGICWTAYDAFSKNLKYYFKSKSDNYSRASKLPDLDTLMSNICHEDFFGSIKQKLMSKVTQDLKNMRQADWDLSAHSPTTCSFTDHEKYSYLNKTIELFVRIDTLRKQGIISYKELERVVLDDLSKFYSAQSLSWAQTLPSVLDGSSESYVGQIWCAMNLERRRCNRCLHPSSLTHVDSSLVKVFLDSYLKETKPFFKDVYDCLFTFENYSKGESGFCSEINKATATKLFEMLVILDKSHGTEYVSQVAIHFAQGVERDFRSLLVKSKGEVDLTKPDRETREKIVTFFSQFFYIFVSYNDIMNSVFGGNTTIDAKFSMVLGKIANEDLFNKSFGDAISMYLDCHHCKSKPRNLTTDSENSYVNNIIKLCTFIDDKVTLFANFQNDLFYRITDENIDDIDKERGFLTAAITRFGLGLPGKLNRLLTSIAESQDFFKFYSDSPRGDSIEVVPLVLDSGVVTRQRAIELKETICTLPFITTFTAMSSIYSQKNASKKLQPMYSIGTCQVLCTYYRRVNVTHTATMGALQALVLSAFHPKYCSTYIDKDSCITFSQLGYLTGITSSDGMGKDDAKILAKVVMSLVRMKLLVHYGSEGDCTPIMRSLSAPVDNSSSSAIAVESAPLSRSISLGNSSSTTPKVPSYTPECRFKANADYKNSSKKFSLPMLKFEHQEKVTANEEITLLLDTAIVRIMKSRKKMKATDLSVEVQKQLINYCKISDFTVLKRRYEALINRDYLERDRDDLQYLIYI